MNVTSKGLFVDTTKSILESVGAALASCGREVPDCSFVGFDRPAEDRCPDLVAWTSNIRVWDGNSMDGGLKEGRLLCFNAFAFDVTIRLGRCYIDFAADGSTIDHSLVEEWSNELYYDAYVMYVQWIGLWKAGGVYELSTCEPLSVGPMIAYKEGGCAGWEFTISVGVI